MLKERLLVRRGARQNRHEKIVDEVLGHALERDPRPAGHLHFDDRFRRAEADAADFDQFGVVFELRHERLDGVDGRPRARPESASAGPDENRRLLDLLATQRRGIEILWKQCSSHILFIER
jgi:hypothetical protein